MDVECNILCSVVGMDTQHHMIWVPANEIKNKGLIDLNVWSLRMQITIQQLKENLNELWSLEFRWKLTAQKFLKFNQTVTPRSDI